ncbi:tryptophan halogenase family protein [Pinirhizobacter sp.]|jgi:tryptophan halogenase|uniref:tryptophan halogenase family protein n=1 Tax=Pinirhizobacter sp. TaxID=2950432 RepID=UPI002F40E075
MAYIKHILVVGGGTAGWLTACYLARTLNSTDARAVQVTLVESPSIGILGVGEATFPSIRSMLSAIGMDERTFLVGADATYKQGIRFEHWVRPPGAPGPGHYFHPFSAPSTGASRIELLPYWLLGHAPTGQSFASAVTMQDYVAGHDRAPKHERDPDWQGPLNHAFHFDAVRFAAVLAAHGKKLGVRQLEATVSGVRLAENGDIAAVLTPEAGALSADLYIDCTGQKGVLVGGALGSAFLDRSDVLFVDRAVALQVPYPAPDAPIRPYTVSHAAQAGWIWDIGLQQRRGTGYVYSSAHTSDDQAEAVLRTYLGVHGQEHSARLLKFKSGYRPRPWVRNCVAIGLAGGFLEPLESTGIALIELSAYLVAHLLPGDPDDMVRTAHVFNHALSERYERIIDFLKMHYCLSQREDSAFWQDNRNPETIPETLRNKLASWRHRPPHRLDFVADHEMFLPASWQYILYGMEYRTTIDASLYLRMEDARREFANIASAAVLASRDLPGHRALVERMAKIPSSLRGFV